MIRQQTLDMAARLISEFEGCKLTPYQDSGGVWTIGIGSIMIAGKPVSGSTPAITMDKATELLTEELTDKASFVVKFSPENAADNELAAVISFTYNVGETAYFDSTLRRKWLANDLEGAADAFLAWDMIKGHKSRGLGNRRKIERQVFLGEIVV